MGIRSSLESVENVLWDWWSMKPANEIHKLILKVTPIFICWELWRQRNACKFGEKKRMWTRSMIQQICRNIKLVVGKSFVQCQLPDSWEQICSLVFKLKPVRTCIVVKWLTPPSRKLKLNTDGSFATNMSGIGGILRNSAGGLIMAFSYPLKCESINIAEAMAAKEGLSLCVQQGILDIIVEMDSKIIVDIMKKRDKTNLKLKAVIEDILKLLDQIRCEIVHRYREANAVADSLAKEVVRLTHPVVYSSYQNLSRVARGSFNLDKNQLRSLRLRYDKANFFDYLSSLVKM